MKVIDLLNKIANGEIENDTIFYVKGDFFYDLIVIDEKLYVINSITKQLELLESKYIGRFIRDDVELAILKEVEIIEEKEMCHKCGKHPIEYNQTYCEFCLGISEEEKKIPEKLKCKYTSQIGKIELAKTINEIIDYLEENK